MKKRWAGILILAVVLAALFLPAAKVYVHSQLGAETAALFPKTISVAEVMLKGADCLPAAEVPQLGLIGFNGWMLLAGVALLALAAAALAVGGRWIRASIVLSFLSLGFTYTFSVQMKNLCGSILFTLLLESQAWIYAPAIGGLVMAALGFVHLKDAPPARLSDRSFRLLSGVLAILAVLCLLLPSHVVSVPETVTADPADAAAMCRATPLWREMLGNEPNLRAEAEEKGVYSNVLTGDIEALVPYSNDANNIHGIFTIGSSTASLNAYLIAAVLLLALTALLAFLPGVDRWFPLSLSVLALICVGATVTSLMSLGSGDMFSTATRQLCQLGLGSLTVTPMLMALLTLGSAGCGVLGVRYANEPYFVNPIPQRSRLRVIALTLAVVSLAFVLLPSISVSFTKPEKNKVLATVKVSGLKALTLHAPDELLRPTDSKSNSIYGEENEEGGMSTLAVESLTRKLFSSFGVSSWIVVVLILAGIAAVLTHRNKKLAIFLFLLAFAARLVTWLLAVLAMPRSIGSSGGTVFLYVSLPLLLFAAFFSNFVNTDTLPKKYKLFLMMLPFLVAVFLFSYLPLYGWSYAFYNYKFGIPMDQQEFVGFKWFLEMFTNQGHRDNIVRVLKNTFGMSGLNLATSFLPMVFAIFLNEINNVRFKKFVQIFTTLPNFISWALVFSFAMAMFAMDTGIFSKLMLSIGAIKEPVAWLNSSEHIWLKMWGWSTWKGLGWGAIMYLAAIAGIDQELYEAARVDGANRWKQMRYITLPGLLPTFFVLFMLSVSNILNNGMDQYMVFQNSMNKNTIEVLDLYVYNITIASKGTVLYSFATAIGILKTLVSVTLLFSANFLSKKLRGESIV